MAGLFQPIESQECSPGHLDHHVEGVVTRGQGDVMEGGDGPLTVLDKHLVGVSVGLPPLLRSVSRDGHRDNWTQMI